MILIDSAAGDYAEGPIGDLDEELGNGSALALVAVERGRIDPTLPDVREKQREVVRILKAGVHSLAADGGVHVCGIACEEDRSDTKP
jgi:hypothetical protein